MRHSEQLSTSEKFFFLVTAEFCGDSRCSLDASEGTHVSIVYCHLGRCSSWSALCIRREWIGNTWVPNRSRQHLPTRRIRASECRTGRRSPFSGRWLCADSPGGGSRPRGPVAGQKGRRESGAWAVMPHQPWPKLDDHDY